MERIVIVELVTLNDERNLREQLPDALANREEKKSPEATPPPPAPPKNSTPRRSAPPSLPKNSMSDLMPLPKPSPVVDKVKPEEQARVDMPDAVRNPIQKPDPPSKPDPFEKVLKSVEEFEAPRQQTPEPDPVKDQPALPAEDLDEQILAWADTEFKSDEPLTMCEKCDGPLRKEMNNMTFHLYGPGFYKTDNKRKYLK